MGASPTPVLVNSITRISIVFSSPPIRSLRQVRRFGSPIAQQHLFTCVTGMLARIPLIMLASPRGGLHSQP
jgi:hypothetical protein